MRAGQYVRQVEGYQAFIPAPLPPQPPPQIDQKTLNLLSRADLALGRLDGVTSILPNPDLFVAMFVRQEAVLSSQIEGTQSTLEDVLQFEVDEKGADLPKDIGEVVNYVNAIKFGLKRLRGGNEREVLTHPERLILTHLVLQDSRSGQGRQFRFTPPFGSSWTSSTRESGSSRRSSRRSGNDASGGPKAPRSSARPGRSGSTR